MKSIKLWLFPIALTAFWTLAAAYTLAGAPI